MAQNDVVSIRDKFRLFQELWSPKIVAKMNDYHLKIAKVKGEFVWHQHDDTDEVFLVVDGVLEIELPDRVVSLKPGELFVVPKGVRHKPKADEEAHILLIEPAGTANTGEEAASDMSTKGEWL